MKHNQTKHSVRQDGELGWTQEKHPVDSSRDCIPTIPNLPVRCMPQTDRRLHDVGRTLPGETMKYQQVWKKIRENQHGNAHVKSQMLQTLQDDEQLYTSTYSSYFFVESGCSFVSLRIFERCFSEQPACQFTPTLWSWILFQSTSSISCVDNFLYCFHILLLATPLQSSKRNTIVFYEYKSDSTAEQNKQQNKWCLWKSKQHAFSTINSMPGRFELPFAPVETHGTGRSLQTFCSRLSVIHIPTSYNSRNNFCYKVYRTMTVTMNYGGHYIYILRIFV